MALTNPFGSSLTAALTCLLMCAVPLVAQHRSAFDHRSFDELLRAHVTEDGLVDYDAFEASPGFASYLESLDEADLGPLPESERLALWINAYNAYTIQLVNEHDERESIRNINKTLGLFSLRGPWSEKLARVAGYAYSLDQIEHEVIRKRYDEPRIHFALVCAALGCPPLRREAYAGAALEAQLEDQAVRFLSQAPDKNRVEADSGAVHLSRIFDWYREDFPQGDNGLGEYLAPYFADPRARALLMSGDFEVEHTEYDWRLNSVGRREKRP